jgi:serine/threonine protein kinase
MLLGNYRIVERLGEGGMGVVYIGRHETLGHRAVVKVLRLELSHNADMVQRFFNEAQAATAIRNPGIVQVFDFGTIPDGRAYLVMELLEGETLSARLEKRQLDYRECCRIGRQVAKVLQAAHARGITHRDLKPDNLYLVRDDEVVGGERVKVLDFGIAKLAGEVHASRVKTRTGAIMGTPIYMSPEQCRGTGAVDARADIYSLGCILFEMTCARRGQRVAVQAARRPLRHSPRRDHAGLRRRARHADEELLMRVLAWLALLCAGCLPTPPPYHCVDNRNCDTQSGGRCEESGYCSFPDPSCPSGRRYGEAAGPLAGVCVVDTPPSDGGIDGLPGI